MVASNLGKVLLAGAAVVAQLGGAVPAHAMEAEPLPDVVLREITGTGLGSPSLPEFPRGHADRLDVHTRNAEMNLNRAFADYQPILNLIGMQVVRDVFTNSQSATNLTLAVTMDGSTVFASIRR